MNCTPSDRLWYRMTLFFAFGLYFMSVLSGPMGDRLKTGSPFGETILTESSLLQAPFLFYIECYSFLALKQDMFLISENKTIFFSDNRHSAYS